MQLQALEIYLTHQSVSAAEVAKKLTEPFVEALGDRPKEFDTSGLWRTIAEAIKEFTEANDRLTELVKEIQKV